MGVRLVMLVGGLSLVGVVHGQEPSRATPPVPFRLADGTVLLYTPTPEAATPKIDGVVLSPADYQALVARASEARPTTSDKPSPPSVCHITAVIRPTKPRPTAVLKLRYGFRTATPNAPVLLGNVRAYPTGAVTADGKLPVLELTADGLVVRVPTAGEHSLTLDLETTVTPRNGASEIGFDVGLPRAAITTLAVAPPSAEVAKLIVQTRTPDGTSKVADMKRSVEPVARFAAKADGTGGPLGPIDLLDLGWDLPTPTAVTVTAADADADVVVRVDEASIETASRLRLRGPARDWLLPLQVDAEVAVTRANDAADAPVPMNQQLTRPTDAKQPWRLTTAEAGEWVVTAVVRSPRPEPKNPKHPGPYAVGLPVVAGLPRQTGTVRVFAPATVRLSGFQTSAEVRRQDAPAGPDAPAAVFKYTTADSRPPRLAFEARPARGFVAVQPHHKLELFPDGWHLRTELRVAPVRTFIDTLTFDLPSGWAEPRVLPFERVDEVQIGPAAGGRKPHTVKLAVGLREPFTLTLETRFAVAPTATDVSLPLPRFPGAVERDTRLTATVADGLTVRGVVRELVDGPPTLIELKSTGKPGSPAGTVAGTFDAPVGTLDLTWQPVRPELAADVRVEIVLGERQASVSQTIRVQATDPIGRTLRLRGPRGLLGVQMVPAAEPTPTGWTVPVPDDVKETTVTINYAVPLPPRSADGAAVRADLPLVWPDAAKTTATVRIWGTPSAVVRRPTTIYGPWDERPPEPSPDRDSLPWHTLVGTGPSGTLPLAVDLVDPPDGGPVVDRAAVQLAPGDAGGTSVRTRFVFKRWSTSGVDVDLPSGVVPTLLVNKERFEPPPAVADDGTVRTVRVPLPEPRPNRPTVTLEVVYLSPATAGGPWIMPARVRGAVYVNPVWWHATPAASYEPLTFGPLSAEFRWGLRGGLPTPQPATTAAELDRWLAGGGTADTGETISDVAVTGRQAEPTAVRVVQVPRLPFVFGCSLVVLLAAIGLSQVKPIVLGLAITLFGGAAGVAAVLAPQPTARIAAAAGPGLLAAGVGLVVYLAFRWAGRRRITHLPAFTRGGVGSGVGSGANGRARPSDVPALGPTTTG